MRQCIVAAVKPFELICHLVVRRGLAQSLGLGSLPLARALGNVSLQSSLYKFMNGQVSEPARSTAELLAGYFSIPTDAIYDERLATQLAKDLGIPEPLESVDRPTLKQGVTDDVRQDVTNPSTRTGVHAPMAQRLSDPRPIFPPHRKEWGDLVNEAALPSRFQLQMRDDSMTGFIERDEWVICSRTAKPRVGRGVLVADRHGNYFVRLYEERRPGLWFATAKKAGYQALESEADGLRIVAAVLGSYFDDDES